jgi:hypothetical protein
LASNPEKLEFLPCAVFLLCRISEPVILLQKMTDMPSPDVKFKIVVKNQEKQMESSTQKLVLCAYSNFGRGSVASASHVELQVVAGFLSVVAGRRMR